MLNENKLEDFCLIEYMNAIDAQYFNFDQFCKENIVQQYIDQNTFDTQNITKNLKISTELKMYISTP